MSLSERCTDTEEALLACSTEETMLSVAHRITRSGVFEYLKLRGRETETKRSEKGRDKTSLSLLM